MVSPKWEPDAIQEKASEFPIREKLRYRSLRPVVPFLQSFPQSKSYERCCRDFANAGKSHHGIRFAI